jgi:hypothetical protein
MDKEMELEEEFDEELEEIEETEETEDVEGVNKNPIHLVGKFYFSTNKYNFIISKKELGNKTFIPCAYYTSLLGALQYIDKEIFKMKIGKKLQQEQSNNINDLMSLVIKHNTWWENVAFPEMMNKLTVERKDLNK